jgi:hypothetical protein
VGAQTANNTAPRKVKVCFSNYGGTQRVWLDIVDPRSHNLNCNNQTVVQWGQTELKLWNLFIIRCYVYVPGEINIAHETAICRIAQNSSNRDTSITGQLGYQHTFCQYCIRKKLPVLIYFFFRKCISAGLFRFGQVLSDWCKTAYHLVTTNCWRSMIKRSPSRWYTGSSWFSSKSEDRLSLGLPQSPEANSCIVPQIRHLLAAFT